MKQATTVKKLFSLTYGFLVLALGLSRVPVAYANDCATVLPKSAKVTAWLDQYYAAQKSCPTAAKTILTETLRRYPHSLIAHKEMGYLLLKEQNLLGALQQFKAAEQLAPKDWLLKMEIGYILNKLKRNREAYYDYFAEVAAQNEDKKLQHTANAQMTSMAGSQTKLLPEPWFADFYTEPFYYHRFNLLVVPAQLRVGRTFGEQQQLEVYLSLRATDDNKSRGASVGQLAQFYDDNVAVLALGASYAPFYQAVPGLRLIAEGGEAYDLIRKNAATSRWRGYLRTGATYYGDWGAKPQYVEEPAFPLQHVGNFYTELFYYSRYNGNIIGYATLKEGLRIAQYRTTMLDFYLRARASLDKHKEFYNNFIEVGPGLELTPNNRYNVNFRFEYLQGHYFNVDSASPNPYGSNYHNALLGAVIYFKV